MIAPCLEDRRDTNVTEAQIIPILHQGLEKVFTLDHYTALSTLPTSGTGQPNKALLEINKDNNGPHFTSVFFIESKQAT
ncbi:hypothetical protein ACJX0J_007638, partial [Zea mays]